MLFSLFENKLLGGKKYSMPKFQDAFNLILIADPNDNFCAASGVQASKWSGDSVVGELLPSVQGWCVCQSRESI